MTGPAADTLSNAPTGEVSAHTTVTPEHHGRSPEHHGSPGHHGSPVTPDARRAWRAIQEIQLHGEGQNRFANACAHHDLPPSSVKALLRLSDSRPTAMRDLATAFACDASYITAVVDALEQRGLATREPHPTDRRIRTVVLTDHGRDISASVLNVLSEPPSSVAALSQDEQRQLADLLEKVAAADAKLAERRASS